MSAAEVNVLSRISPGAPSPAAPLVVVLHGCGQTAAAMASASGWSELAERLGFHVLYPEQRAANNPLGCFNWFAPADASPGGGEARSIEQMIDAMLAAHDIDGARVFVSGFSAGAAMAVALAAGYPERFAGGAIVAGVPAGCASDALSGQSCMAGADETPAAWAAAARALRPGYSGSYPRMVFFHGTLDAVVDDANLAELVEQWTALHGLDQTPESSETFRGHERQRHGVGQPAVESYHIAGLGHALPVDPGGDDDQGGEVGLHASDEDLWAAYYAAAFWGLVGG